MAQHWFAWVGFGLWVGACAPNAEDEAATGPEASGPVGAIPSAAQDTDDGTSVQPSAESGEAPCVAPEPLVIAEGEVSAINVTDDYVYYIDEADGPELKGGSSPIFAGSVKRYEFATAATTTLWVGQTDSVRDILVTSDELFLYASAPFTNPRVYRMPLTGEAEPTLLGPQEGLFDGGYIRNGLMGLVGDQLVLDSIGDAVAISVADGSVRTLIAGDAHLVSVQLVGSQLWYATDEGRGGIFRLDVADVTATPVEVYPAGCTDGDILKVGWFHASESQLYCAGSQGIQGYAADGAGPVAMRQLPRAPRRPVYYPAYIDDTQLYLASGNYGAQLPLGGDEGSFFACHPVAVDGIASSPKWLVWGQSKNAGVVTSIQPLYLRPVAFSGIFALAR